MHAHYLKLAVFFSGLFNSNFISQLKNGKEEELKDFLFDLGRRHYNYASSPPLMELLGNFFVDSIAILFEDESDYEETKQAWSLFFSFVVFEMARGYNFVKFHGLNTSTSET